MQEDEITKRLLTADWGTILSKLVIFARKRGNGRNLRGSSPRDVAMEAVLLVFEGARSRARGELPRGRYWDGRRDLLDFLRGVVNSLLSNHHHSKEKRTLVSLTPEMLSLIKPEEFVLNGKTEELDQRLIARIENDHDLRRVYALIRLGTTRPAELAFLLNLPVPRIKKLKIRIRSLARQLRQDIA